MENSQLNSNTTSQTIEGGLMEQRMSAPDEQMEIESKNEQFGSTPLSGVGETMVGREEEPKEEEPMEVDEKTDEAKHSEAGALTKTPDDNGTQATTQPPGSDIDEGRTLCQYDQGGEISDSQKDFHQQPGRQMDNRTLDEEQSRAELTDESEVKRESDQSGVKEGTFEGTGAADLDAEVETQDLNEAADEYEVKRESDQSGVKEGTFESIGTADLDAEVETQDLNKAAGMCSIHKRDGKRPGEANEDEGTAQVKGEGDVLYETTVGVTGTKAPDMSSALGQSGVEVDNTEEISGENQGDNSVAAQAVNGSTSSTNRPLLEEKENVLGKASSDTMKKEGDEKKGTAVKADKILMATDTVDNNQFRVDAPACIAPGLSPQQEKEQHDETPLLGNCEKGKKRALDSLNLDAKKSKKKGGGHAVAVPKPQEHYGLRNQGATCYLNSVLQLLLTTPELESRLDLNTPFDKELQKLFLSIDQEVCETNNIIRILEVRNVFQQRDAAECLDNIFQKLSPGASEMFRATLRNTTTCCKSHEITCENLQCWSLTFPLISNRQGEYDVRESAKMFFEPKLLSDVFCPTCREKTEATRESELVKAPPNLIVLLARFDFNYGSCSYIKSPSGVLVPSSVMMNDRIYTLCGMVDHSGSLSGGHYTTTAWSSQNQTKYTFNDSHVTKEQYLHESTQDVRTEDAYLLKYRKGAATSEPQSSSSADPVEKGDGSFWTHEGCLSKMRSLRFPGIVGFGFLLLAVLLLLMFHYLFGIL